MTCIHIPNYTDKVERSYSILSMQINRYFAALIFKKKKEQQRLKERFELMGDILESSWAYQEMVQKGVVKGLAQGLKQEERKGLKKGKQQGLEHVVFRFVELHFPDLVPLAKQQAALATTSQQLQAMLDQLFVAHTDDEARAILLGEL